MPKQIIDLRSYLKKALYGEDYSDITTLASNLSTDSSFDVKGNNYEEVKEDLFNKNAQKYVLVGESFVGDGSVVGP